MNWEVVGAALAIMGKGMLGIFVTICIIMVFVWILGKMSGKKDK